MVANKFRYMVIELFLCEGGSSSSSNNDNRNKSWRQIEQQQRQQRTGPRLTQLQVFGAIRQSIQLNFGQHGAASCNNYLQVKYFNPITNVCVLRCSRREYQRVWCSITFINSIDNIQTLFNLLDLSGNMRACRRKALKHDAEKLKLLQQKLGTSLMSEQVEEAQACTSKIKLLEG